MGYFACLRGFLRIAELGSFSRAAAADGAKITTLSHAITALETGLGAALFDRSARGVRLT